MYGRGNVHGGMSDTPYRMPPDNNMHLLPLVGRNASLFYSLCGRNRRGPTAPCMGPDPHPPTTVVTCEIFVNPMRKLSHVVDTFDCCGLILEMWRKCLVSLDP